jgi:hypothetical protein
LVSRLTLRGVLLILPLSNGQHACPAFRAAGMNLINERLADSGWVLAAVMAGMLAVAAALFGGVAVYARRHKLMFIPTQL